MQGLAVWRMSFELGFSERYDRREVYQEGSGTEFRSNNIKRYLKSHQLQSFCRRSITATIEGPGGIKEVSTRHHWELAIMDKSPCPFS